MVKKKAEAVDQSDAQYPHPGSLELARATSAVQERVVSFLDRLRQAPPQVLILEGGRGAEREAFALYWAALLNCESQNAPCLDCPTCEQFFSGMHRDLIFRDGKQGSLKIDYVRALKPLLSEPPRNANYRMVLFLESHELSIEAANSFLKSLEEPNPGTRFVLSAPQRERLLPTLVSRGFVMTLGWPDPLADPENPDPAVGEWTGRLVQFLNTGQGWMAASSAKGAVDKHLVAEVTVSCQRELARATSGRPGGPLAQHLSSRFNISTLRKFDMTLSTAQDALAAGVNPALVIDWIATKTYALKR